MDQLRILAILFFPILFLIGLGFSLLTYIPRIQQFLLRSLKSRGAGLLLLAILSFLTGLLFTSRLVAEALFVFIESEDNHAMSYTELSLDWDWIIQNKHLFINEFWIEGLIPTLSEEICFSSEPIVCKFAGWSGVNEGIGIIYAFALIPAFATFVLGWLFIRKRIILVAS